MTNYFLEKALVRTYFLMSLELTPTMKGLLKADDYCVTLIVVFVKLRLQIVVLPLAVALRACAVTTI
jgi:hypothetical protein